MLLLAALLQQWVSFSILKDKHLPFFTYFSEQVEHILKYYCNVFDLFTVVIFFLFYEIVRYKVREYFFLEPQDIIL